MHPIHLFAAAALLTTGAISAQAPAERLRVAVLWWGDHTADAPHWRTAFPGLLAGAFERVDGIRIARPAAIRYAFRELELRSGAVVDRDTAVRLARRIAADRVVFGSYARGAGAWQVSLQVAHAGTGEASTVERVEGADWFEALDRLARVAARELRIELAEPIERRVADAALDWFARAHYAQAEQAPLPEQLDYLERAAELDAASSRVQIGLASTLMSLGRLGRARNAANRALELEPDSASAHGVLGAILATKSDIDGASRELQASVHLDPRDPTALLFLSQVYVAQGRVDDALDLAKRAVEASPYDPAVRGNLARTHAVVRDRDAALTELTAAERLADDEPGFLYQATEIGARIGELARAVDYGERFLIEARARGLFPDRVAGFERRWQALRDSLEVRAIPASLPRRYSREDLERVIAGLSETDRERIVLPFESNPEIDAWARRITEGIDGDLERSRRIFRELIRRMQPERRGGTRTARQVHAAWEDPDEGFNCQELAKLYVAMARAVGLDAFLVHLERDHADRIVYHDCAAVFVEEQAYLVDPAYRWFGIVHRDYEILDDVQAIAHQLAQGSGVESARLACALHPEFAWAQVRLAGYLLDAGRLDEAEAALAAADRFEPGRWDVAYGRAGVAAAREDWTAAESFAREGIDENPAEYRLHALLGHVLINRQQPLEAWNALREAEKLGPPPKDAERIGKLLAVLGDRLWRGKR